MLHQVVMGRPGRPGQGYIRSIINTSKLNNEGEWHYLTS